MLARLQKLLVFTLIAASVIWATVLARSGHPAWGGAVAVVIVLGYAAFLALEFAALHSIPDDCPAPRARLSQLVAAWWGEVLTAPRVFFWRQPFRSRALADHVDEDCIGRHGVVLVHGFVCNRGLWNPWMRALRAHDIPHIAVNLEPVFGSIDAYADIIDAAVSRLQAATGRTVVVVGHSMGGLAIRGWLRRFNADASVRRVLTIASPHHGTWLARFGHTQNGKQMRQRSPWLTQLAADEPAARYERFTCFYGHCDNIVFPASTAMLSGAENLHVSVTAHVDMAFHPVVFSEALRWLSAAPDALVVPSTLSSADAR
jgi:pimeloyl-ACP methyl ester carboxylesterase